MPLFALYATRTIRRAEERDRDWGASGGNNVWNDFIKRVRCGGVVGPGGGNDANTS